MIDKADNQRRLQQMLSNDSNTTELIREIDGQKSSCEKSASEESKLAI